jgi:outer membrane protein assembly factor BamA
MDGNPAFDTSRAGANDSDAEDYVTGDGWDNFLRLKFKYLLPIGHGMDHIVNDYQVRAGMLVSGASGGESWNPLASGRTFLEVRPFYRSQDIDGEYIDSSQKTNGLDVSLFWDNRDFALNPSRGNGLRLKASRDFGWADSSNPWTEVEGEVDQYFPLGASPRFRQRVVVLDAWTAYSPTWETRDDGTIAERPPAYTGATLGGLVRMRGYPSQRFSDKAAVCYSAEARLIPVWNPFAAWPGLQRHLGVQWVQFVPFVEAGRVAPAWHLGTLHTDMRWDAGLGIRVLAKGLVVRVDTAVSEDGTYVQMMVAQPFQF